MGDNPAVPSLVNVISSFLICQGNWENELRNVIPFLKLIKIVKV